ncbi:MAG: hypothetical protein IM562_13205 [Chitinophagaceae bacterium]|jgi:hypothetical protein|nr:hypothetical protein [Chitinophagaceae bacterium]MCA6448112.1 hypothetical protein [Chitinophagaceae bacterium]
MLEQVKGYEQVAAFYDTISNDHRITVYHISLYLALLQLRSVQHWQNPILIRRVAILSLCRMSRRKYNLCMADLQAYGYIEYEYSADPRVGSKVYFKKL